MSPSAAPTASAPGTISFSRLNTRPACAPVNASAAPSRAPPHDSGSSWVASPSMRGFLLRYVMPGYPGARAPRVERDAVNLEPRVAGRDRALQSGGESCFPAGGRLRSSGHRASTIPLLGVAAEVTSEGRSSSGEWRSKRRRTCLAWRPSRRGLAGRRRGREPTCQQAHPRSR